MLPLLPVLSSNWVMSPYPISCPVNPKLLCGEYSSTGPCLSVSAQQACMAWVLVTGINQGPLPGNRDLYPGGVGGWGDGVDGGGRGGGAGDLDAPPSIHTYTQPLNGNAILSPPIACPLWNTSLIWKRHAYVFMWPPAPCPRANPNQ